MTSTQIKMYGKSYESINYAFDITKINIGLPPLRFVKLNDKNEIELGNTGNIKGITTYEISASRQSIILRGLGVAVELDGDITVAVNDAVFITPDGKVSNTTGLKTNLYFTSTHEMYTYYDINTKTNQSIKIARVDLLSGFAMFFAASTKNNAASTNNDDASTNNQNRK